LIESPTVGRREKKEKMKFKIEVSLLAISIALFAVAVYFYSYHNPVAESTLLSQSISFPYRGLALLFVGVGSVSMVTASISYSKKTKELMN
jgi:hypothetical protein